MALNISTGGRTATATPTVELDRVAIPADVAARVSKQCPTWSPERLVGATYTRDRHSSFPACKAELAVYDATGRLVVKGREFDRSPSAFWDA